MSTNPYAPPKLTTQPPAEVKYSGIGVYCDRGTLVLSRSNHKLPGVCLKTGQPTDGKYPIRVKTLPRGQVLAVAIAGGIIGVAIANLLFGTKFHLDIPIVPGWVNPKDPSLEKTKRGWGVVGLGLLLILLGMGLTLIAEAFMLLCAIGMIVGIVGLFLGGYKSTKKPFEISTFDAKYVWLNGVEPSIASQFEPFPRK